MDEIRLSGAQLRVLAHPLRSRLLTSVRLDGPATATVLAKRLATNTGATSYHLRQLAGVGLVVEEARPGAGRQRWWRAAHQAHGWLDADVAGDPDDRAAADWLAGHYLRASAELAQAWLAERDRWPAAWRQAATYSDFLLELTADQLGALNNELTAVVQRYRQQPAPPDAEQVLFVMHGFPRRTRR